MKTVRRTFVTLFVTAFSVVFALLLTVLVAAACSEKVTLRFETGDGTYLASVEGPSGGAYPKPQDPEKEGFFFDGWYSDASFTGEELSLPDVLPSHSATYYAKYVRCPVLTLETEGGSLAQTEHRIRPGTDLLGYLSDYVPQKDGLVFGGWELDGVLLSDGVKMTEEDMRLSARYKAEYEVAVFLQSADEPDQFIKSEELSYAGADWLGTQFTARTPAVEHFLYDAESSTPSARLREGENLFTLCFTREKLTLRYGTRLPDGNTEEGEIGSRYGAHITLPSPACPEGYTFFGWADGNGTEYAGGETVTLERSLDLSGGWGKLYPNVRGEGILAVEVGEGETLRADFTLGEERVTGQYFPESGAFVAGDYRGRLARGGFLPDDSGRYVGSNLAENASGEQYGVLTLDFGSNTAVYSSAQSEVSGGYVYDYDETAQRYTGDYVFSAGGLSFRFRLGTDTFLRQGNEKNAYTAYDLGAGAFLSDRLSLDGYGGGVWKRGETALAGSYRGGGKSGEWEFAPAEGEPFRILLGERVWSDGQDFAREQAFLYFDPALSGEYVSAAGTLTLDGYGLKAVYRAESGEIAGPFTREGNIVTVQAETPLKFTLIGSGFVQTGEENGAYTGAKGTLVLDGAGGAVLRGGNLILAEGAYGKDGEDWLFSGEESFRFRLSGSGYLVYDEENYGAFESEWGPALQLDGFGGAIYRDMFGGQSELNVVYADETLLLLWGEEMRTAYRTLSLTVDRAAKRVSENPSMTAGVFPVLSESEEALLILDGKNGAIYAGKEKLYGTYAVSGRNTIGCAFGDRAAAFLIEEKNGVFGCLKSDTAGDFTHGESVLSLNGFGSAHYRDGNEEFSAPYRMNGSAAEIVRGNELWRFTLGGGEFTLARYARYAAPDGKSELFLQTDGKSAIYRAEKDYFGMYSAERLFLSAEKEFAYRLYGDEYRVYDRSKEAVYRVGDGETLSLDGCGLGTYAAGETEYSGTVTVTDVGIVVFSSEELPALSGMAGFRFGANGTLVKLSEEFGLYTPAEGGALFLQGDGAAYYRKNNVWRVGSYQTVGENEFTFDLYGEEFRFRTERTAEGGAYSVYNAALAAREGEYETDGGTLRIGGYGVTLGERKFSYVCEGAGGFIAREEGTQNYFAFRLGENTAVRAAESRYAS